MRFVIFNEIYVTGCDTFGGCNPKVGVNHVHVLSYGFLCVNVLFYLCYFVYSLGFITIVTYHIHSWHSLIIVELCKCCFSLLRCKNYCMKQICRVCMCIFLHRLHMLSWNITAVTRHRNIVSALPKYEKISKQAAYNNTNAKGNFNKAHLYDK